MAPEISARDTRKDEHPQIRWAICFLVLVCFGLSVWENDAKAIWWDESLSLIRAQNSLPDILAGRIAFAGGETTDQHPPLYFLLLKLVTTLAGVNDAVLRFPSACMTTALIPLLYCMGKRLRNSRTGFFAAALGAFSPFLLWYSQEARMYTLTAFLGLLSTYLLWRAIEEGKWQLYALYVITLLGGLFTHYLFALLFLAQFAFAAVLKPRSRPVRQSKRHWYIIGAFAIVSSALSLVTILVVKRIPELGSNRVYVPLGIMVRDAFNSFSLGVSVNYFSVWPLDVIFWLVYGAGILSTVFQVAPKRGIVGNASRVQLAHLVLLTGYILIPIFVMWLFSLITPLYMGSRYVLMCVPAFILGVALGLDAVATHSRWGAVVLFVILIGSSTYSIVRYYTNPAYANKDHYRSAARFIAANESAADVILVNGAENEPAFRHYYEGNLPIIPCPALNQSQDDVIRQIKETSLHYDRIWLVEGGRYLTSEYLRDVLTSHATLLMEKQYSGYQTALRLSSFYPRSVYAEDSVAPEEALGFFDKRLQVDALSIRYIDKNGQPIRLELSSVGPDAETPLVPAGKTIGLFVTMTVQAELEDYKTSLRILDQENRLIAQLDEEPYIYIPSSTWPVGKAVRFQTYVRIPVNTPPGPYKLVLLVYHKSDGSALPYLPDMAGVEQEWMSVADFIVQEGHPLSYEKQLLAH